MTTEQIIGGSKSEERAGHACGSPLPIQLLLNVAVKKTRAVKQNVMVRHGQTHRRVPYLYLH